MWIDQQEIGKPVESSAQELPGMTEILIEETTDFNDNCYLHVDDLIKL